MTSRAFDELRGALADRYRLERELGAGGMATVYLAHDLRHDRRVAIKVLRPELAAVIGAERFLAEIRTTANLQHPHILPLYDSGVTGGSGDGGMEPAGKGPSPHPAIPPSRGFPYYVMPYVEGESLRDRLLREKQLPVTDAVRIAGEVAGALDYAHRRGVIHRDIKPENILLHDGRALVADFGIALAVSTAGGSRMTETGMSLGTPHYMSPEQAMGDRDLDARSDVYALGATVYEMLTGEPPFQGPTAQAIVAKVMTAEPELVTTYRKTVPPHVEAAVHTAIEKLPADRFPTAADFGAALTDAARPARPRQGSRPAIPPYRRTTALATFGIIAAALAAWGWLRPTPAPPVSVPSRLALLVPQLGGASVGLQRQLALTPDGTTLLYTANPDGGDLRTMRHRLDAPEGTPVAGAVPFLSGYAMAPDGRAFVGQVADSKESYVVSLESGASQPLPRAAPPSGFAAWGPDGTIWIGSGVDVRVGLLRLDPDGTLAPAFDGRHGDLLPMQVLADGRILLVVREGAAAASGPAELLDLGSGETTSLIDGAIVEIRHTAGYLVYATQDGSLYAQAFDEDARQVAGTPALIATDVSLTGTGIAQFAVAANGTVAYIPEELRSLVLVDRTGAVTLATPEGRNFHAPMFSRDGRRIATDFFTPTGRDVWLLSLDDRTLTRATFDRDGHDATWTPDGRSLTYTSAQDGVVTILRARPGAPEAPQTLFASPEAGYTGLWLPDGSALVTAANGLRPGSGADIAILRNAGAGPLEPLIATPFEEQHPAVSPDGRWVAFTSNQSGTDQVYVRPLDGEGEQTLVSLDGGMEPVWSHDGRELFYRGGAVSAPSLMAATVRTSPTFAVLSRQALFPVAEMATATPHSNYDVSPDGRRFVFVRRNPAARIVVIQNLPALLRGGVPPGAVR